VQQLAQERRRQPEECVKFFKEGRPNPKDDDVGILVGDFNALDDYESNGVMHGYFMAGIAGSEGVNEDASAAGLESTEALEERFKDYMISPFVALRDLGWTFAYDKKIGVTSAFGHVIDHVATNKPLEVESAEIRYLTNQKFGNKPPDTDLVITDHNAVQVSFLI